MLAAVTAPLEERSLVPGGAPVVGRRVEPRLVDTAARQRAGGPGAGPQLVWRPRAAGMRVGEPRAPGPAAPGPAEPGPAEPGPAEPGPAEPGPAEAAGVGPVEPGPAEVGLAELGLRPRVAGLGGAAVATDWLRSRRVSRACWASRAGRASMARGASMAGRPTSAHVAPQVPAVERLPKVAQASRAAGAAGDGAAVAVSGPKPWLRAETALYYEVIRSDSDRQAGFKCSSMPDAARTSSARGTLNASPRA
jgi:hypothetical protein